MTVQTTYLSQLPTAYAGMVADTSVASEIASTYLASGTTIAAGLMMVRSTSDTLGKAPVSAAECLVPLGVSIYDASKAPGLYGATLPTGQTFGSPVPVLRKGRIWVTPEVNVVQGEPVFVRHTVHGGLATLGGFRNDADAVLGVDTATQISNARWITSATAPALAQIEINLP